jgi:hypothetical protein
MQAVWWLVWPKLFGPGARAIEGWTPSGHTRLLSAIRLTVAPSHCMYSQQSGQQRATLLRSSSGSAGAGREAVLTAVICFGLCASEEWGFAYMLRSGSKLASACNLTLPLVAACRSPSSCPGGSHRRQLRLPLPLPCWSPEAALIGRAGSGLSAKCHSGRLTGRLPVALALSLRLAA